MVFAGTCLVLGVILMIASPIFVKHGFKGPDKDSKTDDGTYFLVAIALAAGALLGGASMIDFAIGRLF